MGSDTKIAVIYNSFEDITEFLEMNLVLRGGTFIHWEGDHAYYYDTFFVQHLKDTYQLAGKVFDSILYLSDYDDEPGVKKYCETRVRVVQCTPQT